MIVFNIACSQGHHFDGWFRSAEDFDRQKDGGLLECPLCGDRTVTRLPSAPRLNLSGQREAPAAVPPQRPPHDAAAPDQQALWLQAVRHLMANTEDVGDRFAEEARRIHYGESSNRGIRGQTTDDERQALADEGIDVVSINCSRRAPRMPLRAASTRTFLARAAWITAEAEALMTAVTPPDWA